MSKALKRTYSFLSLLLLPLSSILFAQFETVVIAENVNIRACGSTQCGVVSQLSTGAAVQVLAKLDPSNEWGYGFHSWYKIRFDAAGNEGCIFGAFLDLEGLSKINPTTRGSSGNGSIITHLNVNVRSCAALFCEVKYQVNRGDAIKVLGNTKAYFEPGLGTYSWYKIEFQGQTGFVHGKFIDSNAISTVDNTVANVNVPTGSTGTIIGDRVNLRDAPGVNSNIISQLYIGDICTVKEVSSNNSKSDFPWYQVDINGQRGFVYGEYLSLQALGTNTTNVKIWAVLVGISNYSPTMNQLGTRDLNYSEKDARNVYQLLKSPTGGNLPDNQIMLLRDTEATKRGVLLACQKIFQQAGPNDLVFFYFSGHGGPNYFCGYDGIIPHSKLDEVIGASKAKRRLCVADACFSGAWSQNASRAQSKNQLSDEQLLDLYYRELANSNTGIAFLTSSTRSETSLESGKFGQGLFTYFYIEGLKGAADSDQNKIVTLKELFTYVNQNVKYQAMKLYQHSQTPVLKGYFDENMPLSITR